MKKTFILLFLCISFQAHAGKYHPTIDYIFPLPESELVTPKITIILKLDSLYLNEITDLSSLITVAGETGQYSGRTFFATDNRTIIFQPSRELQYDEYITVTIQTSQLNYSDFSYIFHTAKINANLSQSVKEPIQKPMSVKSNAEIDPVRLINGVAVPSNFPRIEAHTYGETAPGMFFYATNYPQEGTGNYLIICKNDGTPYFYRRLDDVVRSGNLTVHPTGVLTAHCYIKWFYLVMDSTFAIIDTIRVGHGYETDNHELQILENGHALLIARDRVKMDMSKIVPGGQTNATVEGNHIQELDRDQNVIFEWRCWDFFTITDTYVGITGGFIDYVHFNSIAVDFDGNLVASARDLHEIIKINHQTGDVIWRLNGQNNEFTFINDPDQFRFQHDFRPVPGKPNHYTVFDNGRGRNPQHSRAVEYKIDPELKTIEKVWEYRHSPDWYTSAMGSAQRLPNGNTLVDFPGGSLRAVEVNPAGEELFEFYSYGHSNYRCRRFDWKGQLPQPYLITENLGTVVRLIFNKFGDEDVAYYNIYYGTTANPTELLTSTSETWFDVRTLEHLRLYYFRVTAVNSKGGESGFSNTETGKMENIGPGQNAIKNSAFESKEYWDLRLNNDAQASGQIDNDGQYQIQIENTSSSMEDVALVQDNILVFQNKQYVFEFDAYASESRLINAKIESASEPHINYGEITLTGLTRRQQHLEFPFLMKFPTDADARVIFYCGGQPGGIFIDNVSLTYSEPGAGESVVKINFQPASVSAPGEYEAETGQPFGERNNGFSYGWLDGANEQTRQRNIHDDILYDTTILLQKNEEFRTWEISLPDGAYQIYLVMGDAGFTDQINTVQIEDVVLEDPDGEDNFDEYTTNVAVTDGCLTIKPTAESNNIKICFLHINQTPTHVALENGAGILPDSPRLFQNYPNPFNNGTQIKFRLSRNEPVKLTLYNVRGQVMQTLINKNLVAGEHSVGFDASHFSSGIYLYKLETSSGSVVRKMLLIK